MDLVSNIVQMYRNNLSVSPTLDISPQEGRGLQGPDGHVEVLAASTRNMDHFLYCIKVGADIITAPYKLLKEWGEKGMPMPDESFVYNPANLRMIAFQDWDLEEDWRTFDLQHDLTDKGIEKFAADWNNLIE
jgi:transaldolase